MEKNMEKFFLPAVLLIAMVALVYFGAQSISGAAELVKTCNIGYDSDNIRTCYDAYGAHQDGCTSAYDVREYSCVGERCVWNMVDCGEKSCKSGSCV